MWGPAGRTAQCPPGEGAAVALLSSGVRADDPNLERELRRCTTHTPQNSTKLKPEIVAAIPAIKRTH